MDTMVLSQSSIMSPIEIVQPVLIVSAYPVPKMGVGNAKMDTTYSVSYHLI